MNTKIAQHTKTFAVGAALIAVGLGLSGCSLVNSSGFDGETLDELDRGGDAPTEIGLAGPDNLVLKVGDTLKIKVKGDEDAIEALRFKRSGDSLTVGRDGDWSSGMGTAIITITMPAPSDISIAGSGSISAKSLAENAEISMAGSGKISVAKVSVDKLEISSAGSGSIAAVGTAKTVDVTVLGSGGVDLAELTAQDAEVAIAGSGDVKIAANGTVEASIAGSGSVYVTGDAQCKSSVAGSGTLTCKSTE